MAVLCGILLLASISAQLWSPHVIARGSCTGVKVVPDGIAWAVWKHQDTAGFAAQWGGWFFSGKYQTHRWGQMGDECQDLYQELSTFIQWSHDLGKMSIGCRSLFKRVFNVNEWTHSTAF